MAVRSPFTRATSFATTRSRPISFRRAAAFALSWLIANYYMIARVVQGVGPQWRDRLNLLAYDCIKIGVVLLSAGVILGGVWADYSWGRFWGWDPKETWALITLLWFLALLHGRFAGWLTGVWTAVGTILGFFLLLMTYYGVSFYLVGLHSYAGGTAKPVPPLLIAYLVAECLLLTAVAAAALRRSPDSGSSDASHPIVGQ